jgi:hypothetical protein
MNTFNWRVRVSCRLLLVGLSVTLDGTLVDLS